MRTVWTVTFALLLLSVAAFAAPTPAPAPAPVSDAVIAAILGEPGGAACAKPVAAGRAGAAGLALKSNCSATANCQGGGTVSCNGTGTCTAVDGDCSVLEAGHVTCNGVTTTCTPACCSSGTQIQKACCRCEATFNCVDCCRCDGGTIIQCNLECNG